MRRLEILFVDSDQQAREKMQHALSDSFVVHCVASVAEAKASLETSIPDVLIAEVALDQESGLDLCRYVRSLSSFHSLPVMLLTSMTTLKDKVSGFDAGADDYVVKPFDAHYLKARISLLARIKHLEERAMP